VGQGWGPDYRRGGWEVGVDTGSSDVEVQVQQCALLSNCWRDWFHAWLRSWESRGSCGSGASLTFLPR
jgi:hypothetical protein